MAVPYDAELDLPQQYRGSTTVNVGTSTPPRKQTAIRSQEHYPYVEIYRKQVVKQADLVLALHLAR